MTEVIEGNPPELPQPRPKLAGRQRVLLVLFILEHALLLAGTLALVAWLLGSIFLGGGALLSPDGGSSTSNRPPHPEETLLEWMFGIWVLCLAYSVIAPWTRRRLDLASIAGAITLAGTLVIDGALSDLTYLIFAFIYAFLVAPPVVFGFDTRQAAKIPDPA